METTGFFVVAAIVIGFGLISGKIEGTILTPPMLFTILGFLLAQGGLGMLAMEIDGPIIHTLAEVTLVLLLFTDASRIDTKLLRRQHDIPVRLLLIGLPLTIALGALTGALIFPVLSIWQALLMAAVLAPTDAALGQAVVSDERVPVRIRQALNVESGLNDGIALPAVLIFMATCGAMGGHGGSAAEWTKFVILQVTLGPLVGALVGYFGAKLVDWGTSSGWMNETFQSLSSIALALLAFSGAELVHGNGFIAAFVGGLVLGNVLGDHCERFEEFGEAEGQLLTLLVFLTFGAVMVPEAYEVLRHEYGLGAVVYAVLSLTVVRMLPVFLATLGKKLRGDTVVFMGWFGPRGIASILFALLVVEESDLPGREVLLAITVLTVLLSIFAHGITAAPAAGRYAARLAKVSEDDVCENHPVDEMRVRIRPMRQEK